MSKVLLDTDILSEYFKGQDKIVARHAANYARQYGTFAAQFASGLSTRSMMSMSTIPFADSNFRPSFWMATVMSG